MRSLSRQSLGEIWRFMAVGGVATAVSFVLFNWLLHVPPAPLRDHPIWAYLAANGVGMVISYELSRNWTWRHRPPRHPDGGRTAYFVINTATMVLPVGLLWFSRHVLGLTDPIADNVSANVLGLLAGQGARFFLFRRFVFHGPAPMGLHDDPARDEVRS